MKVFEPVLQELKKKFIGRYGHGDRSPAVFFAPGRVNLIGEHTDYNGGKVLPYTLTYGTYLLIAFNEDRLIRLASANFGYTAQVPLQGGMIRHNSEWVNYPLGVLGQFVMRQLPLRGMDLLYAGNIPDGAGLSSSASIEMVTAFAVNELYRADCNMMELITMSKRAENDFVGVNCGIMDQFVVGTGRKEHALFLDCRTLDHEMVPVDLGDCVFIISNTNKKRELAASKYNERVGECRQAVAMLREHMNIRDLGEVGFTAYQKHAKLITDDTIRRRARHVITENERVNRAVEDLKKGDLEHFGYLMNASHNSLRYDYEVTGNELDTLVDETRKIDGVMGSRMTGAGFGGCTVTLLKKKALDMFQTKVKEGYAERIGWSPDFYIADMGEGVHRIE
jgi:galactokinase